MRTTPETYRFSVERRECLGIHCTSKYQWVLWIQFDDSDRWGMYEWYSKPSEKSIEEKKDTIVRTLNVFVRHFERPQAPTEVKECLQT